MKGYDHQILERDTHDALLARYVAARKKRQEYIDSQPQLVSLESHLRNAGEKIAETASQLPLEHHQYLQSSCNYYRLKNELIRVNMRFIASIVNQRWANTSYIDDLLQEGYKGFNRALELYEPRQGIALHNYARLWVRQSISKYALKQSSLVHIPSHHIKNIVLIKQYVTDYTENHKVAPTAEQISTSLRIPKSIVKKLYLGVNQVVSMQAPLNEDGATLESIIASPLPERYVEYADTIDLSLQVLNARELDVIRRLYGLYGQPRQTLERIGKDYGMTRERIRQIKEIALKRIRAKIFKMRGSEGINGIYTTLHGIRAAMPARWRKVTEDPAASAAQNQEQSRLQK